VASLESSSWLLISSVLSSQFLVLGISNNLIHIRRDAMDFLSKLLQGIAFVPSVVNGIEGLFASRSGAEKKSAAMSFVSAALQLTDAVTSRHIIDPEKFKQGLSAVIDGTVLCLNASTWAKPTQP
jgi:hypothetical protein